MRGQGTIQIVELCAAGSEYGHGQRQVFALRRRTYLDLAGMKSGIMLSNHFDDMIDEFIVHDGDDYDGKVAWIFDQGFFVGKRHDGRSLQSGNSLFYAMHSWTCAYFTV